MSEKEKIKPRLKQLTRYSDEELYGLFVEGKARVPGPHQNKKRYKRKDKHQKRGVYDE